MKEGLQQRIHAANAEAWRRLTSARLRWVDWDIVEALVPGMQKNIILRAGPPLPFEELTSTQQEGAISGAMLEHLAETRAEARAKILAGEIRVEPGNAFGVACSGTGIVTASMTVNQVQDSVSGARGFCAPFEGPCRGGMAGYGKYSEEIVAYQEKMRRFIVPVFHRILQKCGGLELTPFLKNGLAMGDELHIRQDAATSLVTTELLSRLAETECSAEERASCLEYLRISPRIFHPLDMASAMALMATIQNIPYSTVVCAQCGNAVTYGIRLAGTGTEWFTAPAPQIEGTGPQTGEALPWIGDSCVCEAAGWGAFASAASPLASAATGQNAAEAIALTQEFYEICVGENPNFPIPALDGKGTPCGIDAQKVLQKGILPALHGGRMAADGTRLGAGLARIPAACFRQAMKRFEEQNGTI
ncbi:MAG: DUF1116 domain-containing protein [Victivallales bacterium]|nr:DUF1116 domain-containing protein [Victivallales bacterium]